MIEKPMTTIGNASATPTVWRMWRRLRRRTMAPSRPAVYPEQVGLILLSVLAIAAGVYIVVRVLIGGGRPRGARPGSRARDRGNALGAGFTGAGNPVLERSP